MQKRFGSIKYIKCWKKVLSHKAQK